MIPWILLGIAVVVLTVLILATFVLSSQISRAEDEAEREPKPALKP